jgi:hypothetical protein
MTVRFSHAECSHESTKVARAKCRRDRAKFAAILAEEIETTIPNPIMDEVNAMINGPKMLEMGPKGRDTMRKRAARVAAKK